MGTISYTIPTAGSTLNSIADPEIATALQTLLTWANGNIDAINLSNALAQSACVNESGQAVKGVTNIATSQSTSSTTYTTLATPDSVTGITLATNGLLQVWYEATWQESVSGAARAAIFVGANQLKLGGNAGGAPAVQETGTSGGTSATNELLVSTAVGLKGQTSNAGGAYSGDVATGQIIGVGTTAGVCAIFAAAGSYTISVQFKASSGSVTASNRKLWVQALSFV